MLAAWNSVKAALLDLEAAIRDVAARVRATCLDGEEKRKIEKK